eukprot:TRINITY_DN5158_c0_g1_i6.p2 TRINITY_DN5158_c0_g1~~TRINITY_DN5158_c0_g1_i6.p2  ORF type:complete len:159 (+),score=17.52 TRINITY_DN5158_c0_g1_i6:1645-2121(+)
MDQLQFEHSLKNIPTPGKDSYLKTLIAKTGDFVERLRWKVFFYLNPKAKKENIKTYGFRTPKVAPQSKELKDFEDDLYELVTNIEFKENRQSRFQKELRTHVNKIQKSKNLFVLADKTTNIYEMKPEEYRKLLSENITKDYMKTDQAEVKKHLLKPKR